VADITDDDLVQQALEPISSASDGQSATGRPINDLITVSNYTAAKKAILQRRRGMTHTKMTAPGCLPDGGAIVAVPPFGGGVCG
jgi:hypothetical protein